jgi:inhibitor of KinA sporulation pathway (predicted exonuclease)
MRYHSINRGKISRVRIQMSPRVLWSSIMARKLDRILVVDVEATCWEGDPPSGQISEISEIGLCVLDVPTLARVEQRDIFVRPVCSTVSPYCTQLTTLTQADVDGGVPLAEACQILANECQASARLWASYGDYDRQQFERNCGEFGIPYPFGPTHLNVKNLAAIVYGWVARGRDGRGAQADGAATGRHPSPGQR